MPAHEKLNYVEFPAQDLAQTRTFFQQVFNWQFSDYGPEYTAFDNQGLEGGFYQSPLAASTNNGSALLVFYSEQLEQTQEKIKTAGGEIIKPIFKETFSLSRAQRQ